MAMASSKGDSDDTVCKMNRETIMAELDQKGYCVIPDVMTPEFCDARIASYREWLALFREGDEPIHRHSIINTYRIGHFQATWETRLAVKKVFETVWQTKKLLTSFDAVAISAPPEQGSQLFDSPTASWFHLDQAARRRGLHCYQGAAYLEETTDTDHCLRVLEGSHLHTGDFYREDPRAANSSNTRSEFFRLRDPQLRWYKQRGCTVRKVPVPKGGVVLWDSRLVHDNCRPEEGRPHSDRWRYVVFVCMAPARWAAHSDLVQKKQAYKRMLVTSHWPCQGISFFNEGPKDLSGVPLLDKLPTVARTDEVKLIAGMLDYDFEDGQENGPAWNPLWA